MVLGFVLYNTLEAMLTKIEFHFKTHVRLFLSKILDFSKVHFKIAIPR
jgi:hypothetical protein